MSHEQLQRRKHKTGIPSSALGAPASWKLSSAKLCSTRSALASSLKLAATPCRKNVNSRGIVFKKKGRKSSATRRQHESVVYCAHVYTTTHRHRPYVASAALCAVTRRPITGHWCSTAHSDQFWKAMQPSMQAGCWGCCTGARLPHMFTSRTSCMCGRGSGRSRAGGVACG